MTNRKSGMKRAALTIVLCAVMLQSGFILSLSPLGEAAPVVTDLGDGNKTVSWDFSAPADYTATNVTVSGGASLSYASEQLVHDTTQDFEVNNLTWDMGNLTISGGSIATRQLRRDIIVNGTFAAESPWRYLNSTVGNITSHWNSTAETGTFVHNRSPSLALQFDEMDIGVGTTWFETRSTTPPQHGLNSFMQDTVIYHEFNASANLSAQFKQVQSNWVAIYRNGPWDWSPYNALSVWFNTSYVGAQVLDVYVHLEAGALQWNSTPKHLTFGWNRYEFNITPFSAGLPSISQLMFRFTNITNANPVYLWTDDIWLYRYDRVTQSASIYQSLFKENFSDPVPGTVFLSFRYRADPAINLNAFLSVLVNSTIVTSPSLNVTAGAGWTTATYDVSIAMARAGFFNLTFALRTSIYTRFASYTNVQIDDVTLTIPTYHGGVYVSKPIGIGRAVFFNQVAWSASSRPQTSVTVDVRGGWSGSTGDGSWTQWERHTVPGVMLGNSPGSFLQYSVNLTTTNASVAVSFNSITLTFYRYHDAGRVETLDFVPPEPLVGWRMFTAGYLTVPATTVTFFASDDSGASWIPAVSGTSLDSLVGASVRIRADLTTSNTTRTPRVSLLNVTYEFVGPLFSVVISPKSWSGTADEQVQFTAKGYDRWNHSVAFTQIWATDDPVGSVDSSGLYEAGQEGTWSVCVNDLVSGLGDCAAVTVSHGALVDITVFPPTAFVQVGGPAGFLATGYDSDSNEVPLLATQWLTDVGSFERVSLNSASFRAQGIPAVGHVYARDRGMEGEASVTVSPSSTLYIQGRVPNQAKPEDSPPWSLNVSGCLPPSQKSNDLMWYIEGRRQDLYSVYGERRYGQHSLVFTPVLNAFGNNSVVIWLENRTGARASQQLWVNLTPENDAPTFYDVPALKIRHDLAYVFDYSPYIVDIDDPLSRLILTSNDAQRARVQGLTVNYSYDSSYVGQTVLVRLRISDGKAATETIQVLTIVDNSPPNIVKPLPNVVMDEDQILDRAFPDILSSYFKDADGDQLFFSHGYTHLSIELWSSIPGEVYVRIVPEKDWHGTDTLIIRAKDVEGAEAEQMVIVKVNPVNDPPVLDWNSDVTVKYDEPYSLDLTDYVSDVDNPLSDLVMATNRTELSTVQGFVVNLLLPKYLLGSVTSVPLSISLADKQLKTWSNITVHAGDGWPPMLKPDTSLPDVTFREDEQALGEFDLDDYFEDRDTPMLSYSMTCRVVICTVNQIDNYVSFSAPKDWNGQEVVHARAWDGAGFAIGRLTVRVMPVNDAPVILSIPDQDMGSGGAAAVDLRTYVYDVDNNITELLFSTDSSHAMVVGYMLVLDYRDGMNSETVALTVNDTQLATSRSFRAIVTPVQPQGDTTPLWVKILWPWSLLIVVLVTALFGFVTYNRRLDARYAVEDVFMVGRAGRLIMHTTRHLRADRDEESLAEMLSAVMSFIRDSYADGGEDFKAFEIGERQVLVRRSENFYFVAVYSGEPPRNAQESISAITKDAEATYGTVLATWTGDANEIRDLRAFLDAFVSHRRYKRGDWKRFRRKRREAS